MKKTKVVVRRIEGGRRMNMMIWKARTPRTRRSSADLGFLGLKIDERTSYV